MNRNRALKIFDYLMPAIRPPLTEWQERWKWARGDPEASQILAAIRRSLWAWAGPVKRGDLASEEKEEG